MADPKMGITSIFLIVSTLALFACGSDSKNAVSGSPAWQSEGHGKPSAPISINYTIKGTPAVGQPMDVELSFTTSENDSPVYVSYRIADPEALSLAGTPAEKIAIRMQPANGKMQGMHSVRVIPHREGRHRLNVLTEIHTDIGPLAKSTAVVFEVRGAAFQSKQTPRARDRELQVNPSGEAVISMPVKEE